MRWCLAARGRHVDMVTTFGASLYSCQMPSVRLWSFRYPYEPSVPALRLKQIRRVELSKPWPVGSLETQI